jgi:hypothetical protein
LGSVTTEEVVVTAMVDVVVAGALEVVVVAPERKGWHKSMHARP